MFGVSRRSQHGSQRKGGPERWGSRCMACWLLAGAMIGWPAMETYAAKGKGGGNATARSSQSSASSRNAGGRASGIGIAAQSSGRSAAAAARSQSSQSIIQSRQPAARMGIFEMSRQGSQSSRSSAVTRRAPSQSSRTIAESSRTAIRSIQPRGATAIESRNNKGDVLRAAPSPARASTPRLGIVGMTRGQSQASQIDRASRSGDTAKARQSAAASSSTRGGASGAATSRSGKSGADDIAAGRSGGLRIVEMARPELRSGSGTQSSQSSGRSSGGLRIADSRKEPLKQPATRTPSKSDFSKRQTQAELLSRQSGSRSVIQPIAPLGARNDGSITSRYPAARLAGAANNHGLRSGSGHGSASPRHLSDPHVQHHHHHALHHHHHAHAGCGHSACHGHSTCVLTPHRHVFLPRHHSHHGHGFCDPFFAPRHRSGFSLSVSYSNLWSPAHLVPRHCCSSFPHCGCRSTFVSFGRFRPIHSCYRTVFVPTYYPSFVFVGGSTYSSYQPTYGTVVPTTGYVSSYSAPSSDSLAIDSVTPLSYSEGWDAFAAGDAREARRLFARAIDLRPHDGLPHIGYALAAAALDRNADAIASMRNAMRIDPAALREIPQTDAVLTQVETLLGRFEMLALQNPQDLDVQFMIAALRFVLGEHEPALLAADRVIDGGDRDASASNLRQIILQKLNAPQGALPLPSPLAPVTLQQQVQPLPNLTQQPGTYNLKF